MLIHVRDEWVMDWVDKRGVRTLIFVKVVVTLAYHTLAHLAKIVDLNKIVLLLKLMYLEFYNSK